MILWIDPNQDGGSVLIDARRRRDVFYPSYRIIQASNGYPLGIVSKSSHPKYVSYPWGHTGSDSTFRTRREAIEHLLRTRKVIP